MAEHDEGFLSRWSRRKRGGGATPVVEARANPAAAPPAQAPPAERDGGETTPQGAEDAPPDLPDIDSLDKDSDYTGFLKKGVPQHLQKRALRKLWRSNPVFGFRDGLDDYDEDFAAAFSEAVTGAVKTAYKVGTGFVSPEEEAAEATESAVKEEDGEAAGEERAAKAGSGGEETGAGNEAKGGETGKRA